MVTILRRHTIATTFVLVGCGCGGGNHPQPTLSIPVQQADTVAPATAAVPSSASTAFADCVLTEPADADLLPPPDRTLNGLSTGRLRVEVQKLWDQVAFTSRAGKAISYTATVETEPGTITLMLLPEAAPNHVRNFVALARAGYYDGLVFEHLVQQQGDGPDSELNLIEGGCPLGTGEAGVGHLGYWLRPEISERVKHEEGSVGACRDDHPNTAACRFYITLNKAPVMDGHFTVFAKVTQGLDVVRTIAKQPRLDGSVRPRSPTVIRKVMIQTRDTEG